MSTNQLSCVTKPRNDSKHRQQIKTDCGTSAAHEVIYSSHAVPKVAMQSPSVLTVPKAAMQSPEVLARLDSRFTF